MQPVIGVGLESTTDVLVTFSELEDFEDLARHYDGELAPQIKRGYKKIARASGGEEPIDGKKKEAQELLELAKDAGATVDYALGGNGIQEAATLEKLGAKTIFLGAIFPKSFSKVLSKNQDYLEKTDFDFARTFEKNSPISYIFQVKGENRYILTEGEGRRIDQIRPYLKDLPNTIRKVIDTYGELDALSLVGWHVLFANEVSEGDFDMVTRIIEKIRKETEGILFTDAGGVGKLEEKELRRLCEIYSLFDVISVNEDEVFEVSEALNLDPENELEAMGEILENGRNLSTAWLHTPYYQASLSSAFPKNALEMAQDTATLAGMYKVEMGKYPTLKILAGRRKNRNFSQKGLKEAEIIESQYGKGFGEKEFTVMPCYKPERFFSTVGAGDVSAAAYIYSLSKTKDLD